MIPSNLCRIVLTTCHPSRAFFCSSKNMDINSNNGGVKVNIKKAVILTKFSRFEFEKRRQPNLSDESLRDEVGFSLTCMILWLQL